MTDSRQVPTSQGIDIPVVATEGWTTSKTISICISTCVRRNARYVSYFDVMLVTCEGQPDGRVGQGVRVRVIDLLIAMWR